MRKRTRHHRVGSCPTNGRPKSASLDLAALLNPLDPKIFFQKHWERFPYWGRRNDRRILAGLLSLADIDNLLSLTSNRSPDHVQLVRTEAGVESLKPVEHWSDGTPNIHALYRAYHAGYTIVVNGLHTRWQPVAAMCQALEATFRHRIGANLYATPAGSQGFPPHYDVHNALILQLHGSKSWKIYDPAIVLPLEDLRRHPVDHATLGKPRRKLRLGPGQLLYLPRGWIHEAETSTEPSVHLTIGIQMTSWMDVLIDAVKAAAERSVGLREAMRSPAGETTQVLQARFRQLLDEIGTNSSIESLRELQARRFLADSNPAPDGHFTALDQLTKIRQSTVVSHRADTVCAVYREPTEAVIAFRGNRVFAPLSIEPALRFIAETSKFKVRDLPGNLSASSKLVLVRRLVREGLLAPLGVLPAEISC